VQRIEQAIQSEDGGTRLMSHALIMLTSQVPVMLGGIYRVDQRGEIAAGMIVTTNGREPVSPELAREWYVRRYGRGDPFAPRRHLHTNRSLTTIDDLGGRHAFERTRYAREYLPAIGAGTEVMMYVRDAGRIVGGIMLVRDRTAPDFDDREVRFLRRTQPFIELSYAMSLCRRRPAEHDDELAGRGLTHREMEVARLVAAGATNADIGRALLMSSATVKTHLTRVFAKLGVRSRTQLIIRLCANSQPFG
jgi:DNA-binding CsgD family transcriptional regulator